MDIVLYHVRQSTNHEELWSDICDHTYTAIRTSQGEGTENIHTIERQNIWMVQI